MNKLNFLREGIKNFKTMGTVARSSRFLSKRMIKNVDFSTCEVIVELGAGDGVITRRILSQMSVRSKLFCFEVNPNMIEILATIKDPRLIIIQDSAENLLLHLQKNDLEEVDAIISALPFVILPEELRQRILNTCILALKEDGSFIQMHYSLKEKALYTSRFASVNISFVPLNIPPAFVLECIK